VTSGENTRRGRAGENVAEMQAKKTHCPRGHQYNGENLYLNPKGARGCKACRRAANRASYHRTKVRR
jgi:hypothetical protein